MPQIGAFNDVVKVILGMVRIIKQMFEAAVACEEETVCAILIQTMTDHSSDAFVFEGIHQEVTTGVERTCEPHRGFDPGANADCHLNLASYCFLHLQASSLCLTRRCLRRCFVGYE